ncbi:MarR family winged helix-turn-helix transcriptional regulator [Hoeflea alexandrii]|uniref:MarR family winged helix-turn-helix transcriptional regulator n=1 Tax=Hoeflea alexandrii TaxID=288436 RepID=UPI00226E7F9C|nr:MarR family winged helix-turn-helix transcriptional regulator [Hoeflea alexandrii]MCY0152924.1 MarR family winged helix-turn-helix transcriptional regulator [Hoeflea alexandrii]
MATKKPLDRPRSLGQVLSFATGATVSMCQDMLAEHDLTLAQWVILSALWRQDGMLISEIADYSGNNAPHGITHHRQDGGGRPGEAGAVAG